VNPESSSLTAKRSSHATNLMDASLAMMRGQELLLAGP